MAPLALPACTRTDAEHVAPPGRNEQVGGQVSFVPEAGYVPDSQTAVRMAEAVLTPVYGSGLVERQRPFRASLEGEIWKVEGSIPENHLGGVSMVELAKTDGRIIRMSHSQ